METKTIRYFKLESKKIKHYLGYNRNIETRKFVYTLDDEDNIIELDDILIGTSTNKLECSHCDNTLNTIFQS